MQIKLMSKGVIELSENGTNVIVAFPEAAVPETAPLILGQQVHAKVIRRPGEYEFANVGLQALETKSAHIGTAELFNVEVGGFDTLFVMNDFGTLSKDDWDMLDNVQVMVVSLKEKVDGLDKLINRLLPYVVIAIDAPSEMEAENMLGLKPMSTEDKFKFTEKDFTAEDPATILYLMK